jgi:protein-S-isoprenylcysteine O-methyltransferase Ste14
MAKGNLKPLSSLLCWLKKLDGMIIFDPVRWPHREVISRTTALVIILTFLGMRIYQFNRFPQSFHDAQLFYGAFKTAAGHSLYSSVHIAVLWGIKAAVWAVETAIYLGYVAAYLTRAKPRHIAKGFKETAFPVIVAGLPMVIAFMPYTLPRWAPFFSPLHLYYFMAVMALIILGGVINLIGVLTLRRAFTIMTEARELISHGIFRYVRHPLYTGHFIMFFGSLLLRLHIVSMALYALFCIGQIVRAKIEEKTLVQTFPEYSSYKDRTGMFFPRRKK